MRFVTSPEKLRGGGLITVFDVENRGLRKFNLATLGGPPERGHTPRERSLFAPKLLRDSRITL